MNQQRETKTAYYIILICIIAAAGLIIAAIVIATTGEEETTAETETVSETAAGTTVPYYEDVSVSSYDTSLFVLDENGRMTYTDDSVTYWTGIDVSYAQGTIDWAAVAADGIDFVFVRVGARGYGESGRLITDSYYETNITGALAAGLSVGVYFYSQATSTDEALEEALFVLELIEDFELTAPIIFDWENYSDVEMRTDDVDMETATQCAIAFCDYFENLGYETGIYFNLDNGYNLFNLSEIKEYIFWVAQHNEEYPEFYYDFSIWQYSESGTVDGISGEVDLNISFIEF